MECIPPKDYRCKVCDKSYSTRQNLWKHNAKFHKSENAEMLQNVTNCNENREDDVTKCNKNVTYKCTKCNKVFNNRQTKWRHMKTCTENTASIKEEIKKELTKELTEQFNNILKSAKIHPKTLQKINNQINNNNTNNGTINNNNIIMKFGNVNINDVLSNKQIMNLLHKPFISVEECIKMIHFNEKLPQYNNIYITNLKDDLAYVYDGTRFTTTTKTDTIYDMITNYTEQIELSFDDNKDKLTEYKIKCVENYLELINSNTEYIDQHNKKYTNFKTYKVGDVKRLIYDKSDPKKFAMVCKGSEI
jgi:hypothetical protein